ncbi:hypothetical protein PR202_gb01689 [Eleusine coracana subsp. coracana]|uniref:Structural maintenance of chromosomes protein n=1 Tax=Eleusine coracana subsp. coracana TaxID=191504 RepID=A0AAV5DXA4_ELECO|nr:hypothetical protein PR202_gb01689 [Eleusine coracana subsp. coracana]
MAMDTSPPQSPTRPPGSGARPHLIIKEMVLRNFKSYAGEQRIGPFHKMRLNKVSELIHSSFNHQNADNARVSIHFQEIIELDEGNCRIVEGSDFVISRVAFRDNTSTYYINDHGSNFTEDLENNMKAYRDHLKEFERKDVKQNEDLKHHKVRIKNLDEKVEKDNKQTHLLHRIKEKVKTPEGVPRLFDLVKVNDEKLKLAFYSVLGNTLVANNLDQASELQQKIEDVGGKMLKNQKIKVANIQSIDVECNLQDTKSLAKEWEMKVKAYRKRLGSIQTNLVKHMDQIQNDSIDPEKLKLTLGDDQLNGTCDARLCNARVEELNATTQERDEVKRLEEFMVRFKIISLKLKEVYQMITLGGDAELELVDTLKPFSEGVVFNVRPPKKSWKNIANLSGVWSSTLKLYIFLQTISSLALVFALHHYKPTPLYVMDEIDVALGTPCDPIIFANTMCYFKILILSFLTDFRNVLIVGHYMKDRTKDAQFIIISLAGEEWRSVAWASKTGRVTSTSPRRGGGGRRSRIPRSHGCCCISNSEMNIETSLPESPARTPRKAASPRLFIKEMVLRNFKSYAGEQRIGPFHKSFSAVVGPNGSGKSNVIDAMLFVFGKRAKQDDGNYRAVEGSDFVISRVAFRDNTSKYYINERGSNFTEVTKLLKGKGVDLDNNRFLILQGEVEQISLMKPKSQGPHDEGFLEYLEDIIGTNKYVEKIEEAYKQLEVLNEKRTASVQMLKLAEKERDSLESAKNEAETYMLKELSLLKWREKATKLASDDATSRVAQLQENVADLGRILHLKEFERKDVKHREDLKHLKQKIKKLEDKAEKDKSKIDELTKEMEASSKLIPELEGAIPKLQELFNEEEKLLEQIKANSREETERLRAELTQVRTELEPWEKQIIEHKGKLDVASAEKELMTQKECQKQEELLIPLEQAARQKLVEIKSTRDSEKNQTLSLKTILQAKESNEIQGIYGRLGDLGAIDGKNKHIFFTRLKKKYKHLKEFHASLTCGGGNKPKGGGMGSSIRESISEDAIKNAESNLNKLTGDLNKLREQMNDAKKHYRSLEEAKSRLQMELAKVKKEVESMNAQYSYNEKRLDSLKAASEPKADEASELQQKIENAGGQALKDQKIKVANIQSMMDNHKGELDKTKEEYNKLKKAMDELRASEVCIFISC